MCEDEGIAEFVAQAQPFFDVAARPVRITQQPVRQARDDVTQHARVTVDVGKMTVAPDIVQIQAALAVEHRCRGLTHEEPSRSDRVARMQQSHGLPPLLTK